MATQMCLGCKKLKKVSPGGNKSAEDSGQIIYEA